MGNLTTSERARASSGATVVAVEPTSRPCGAPVGQDAGERMVVVSNRLPVRQVNRGGQVRWETSPGGLVSALTPILREGSTWIGWIGTPGAAPEPFEHDGISQRALPLNEAEIEEFYEGFSNSTLWPLYHDTIRPPSYQKSWWEAYLGVNARYAQAAVDALPADGRLWVHDYHLQLLPAMVRAQRPDARIGFFLHIPFPPIELFMQLPWRRAVLEGLLGADLIGFQTASHAENFVRACERLTPARADGDGLRYEGRTVRTGAFPISIDTAQFEALASSPRVQRYSHAFRARLGSTRRLVLGVDRLDYTKGIDIRLNAYQELLKQHRTSVGESVLVQVAVPSREQVAEYQELKSHIERWIGEINGDYGEVGRAAVHYLHRSYSLEQLVALYMAADVMLVTPLRDGMNLVAKEYAASRINNDGSLVLSEFTGAAEELTAALLINPHDLDGTADALDRALHMPIEEQRSRMQSMRRAVRDHDVHHWARSFLEALES